MEAMILAIVNLATVVVSFIQQEELVKYVGQLKSLQTDLNEEIAKGQLSDDSKIESLYSEIHVTLTAFNNQVAVLQAGKAGTTSVSSGTSSSK